MADTTRPIPASPSGSRPAGIRGEARGEEVGRRLAAEAKEMGAELLGALRDSAATLADEQRQRAAGQIAAVGEALRRSAESLEHTGSRPLAHYAEEAGRQVGDFADRLRTRSWDELAGDVEAFARRWPMVFIAATVGAGFAAGRFLLSSTPSSPAAAAAPLGAARPAVTGGELPGGARHDYGAVSGSVSGNANAGYGPAAREP